MWGWRPKRSGRGRGERFFCPGGRHVHEHPVPLYTEGLSPGPAEGQTHAQSESCWLVACAAGTDEAFDAATDDCVADDFADVGAVDDAAGVPASPCSPPSAAVMVTAAQFILNSCSLFTQVQAKIAVPVGMSNGTVKSKFCPDASSPPFRSGQFPS